MNEMSSQSKFVAACAAALSLGLALTGGAAHVNMHLVRSAAMDKNIPVKADDAVDGRAADVTVRIK